MIFKKGGRNRSKLNFKYDGTYLEIVDKFSYFGIDLLQAGHFFN